MKLRKLLGLCALLTSCATMQPTRIVFKWDTPLPDTRKQEVMRLVGEAAQDFQYDHMFAHPIGTVSFHTNPGPDGVPDYGNYFYNAGTGDHILLSSQILNCDLAVKVVAYHEFQHEYDRQRGRWPTYVRLTEKMKFSSQSKINEVMINSTEVQREFAASEVRAYSAAVQYLDAHPEWKSARCDGGFVYNNLLESQSSHVQEQQQRLRNLSR